MLATRLGRAPRALARRHLSSNDLKFFAGVPEVTKEGVAIIRLDNKSQKMNTLSPALQDEAKMLWKELTSKHDVKAAVFISNKPDNFIAGADIGMLAAKKKAGEEDSLRAVCLSGHAMFDELKGSGVPFVAAIHGACLGGGLEWASHRAEMNLNLTWSRRWRRRDAASP